MALSYNLKYKKWNFSNKVLLEKEGEVVIDRQSFRLKGKGGQDQGEIIYFSDVRDFTIESDGLKLTTYRKETFLLSGFVSLFDTFLKDFFRVRNEYLAEVLFMKVGMLYHEYEGQVDVMNCAGNSCSNGKSRIQFFEGSIVILPEKSDCFPVYFNFLKSHEFDEDEYLLKLCTDSGETITVSKLGTTFEDVQETLESLLGKMYEKSMNQLKEVLPDFDTVSLLKLASLARDGKSIQFNVLKKIHEELPKKFEELVLPAVGNQLFDTIQWLRKNEKNIYVYGGISLIQKKVWTILALPQYNLVAMSINTPPSDSILYFSRIAFEDGDAMEQLEAKIIEINEAMYLLHCDIDLLYKDKQELRKNKYRTALRKVPCLRSLRKSYVGKIISTSTLPLEVELKKFAERGKFAKVSESIIDERSKK